METQNPLCDLLWPNEVLWLLSAIPLAICEYMYIMRVGLETGVDKMTPRYNEMYNVYMIMGFGELQIVVYDGKQANKEMKELRAMDSDERIYCIALSGTQAVIVADMAEDRLREMKPVGRKFAKMALGEYGVTVTFTTKVQVIS